LTVLTGFSDSQFFVFFKGATGLTPLNYFIRLRIRLACELLGDSNLSVKEISFCLGYSDPCYFSRIFKQVTGVAPSHYRNRLLDSKQKKLCYSATASWLNDLQSKPHS